MIADRWPVRSWPVSPWPVSSWPVSPWPVSPWPVSSWPVRPCSGLAGVGLLIWIRRSSGWPADMEGERFVAGLTEVVPKVPEEAVFLVFIEESAVTARSALAK